jgi:hypothetical protein
MDEGNAGGGPCVLRAGAVSTKVLQLVQRVLVQRVPLELVPFLTWASHIHSGCGKNHRLYCHRVIVPMKAPTATAIAIKYSGQLRYK